MFEMQSIVSHIFSSSNHSFWQIDLDILISLIYLINMNQSKYAKIYNVHIFYTPTT